MRHSEVQGKRPDQGAQTKPLKLWFPAQADTSQRQYAQHKIRTLFDNK